MNPYAAYMQKSALARWQKGFEGLSTESKRLLVGHHLLDSGMTYESDLPGIFSSHGPVFGGAATSDPRKREMLRNVRGSQRETRINQAPVTTRERMQDYAKIAPGVWNTRGRALHDGPWTGETKLLIAPRAMHEPINFYHGALGEHHDSIDTHGLHLPSHNDEQTFTTFPNVDTPFVNQARNSFKKVFLTPERSLALNHGSSNAIRRSVTMAHVPLTGQDLRDLGARGVDGGGPHFQGREIGIPQSIPRDRVAGVTRDDVPIPEHLRMFFPTQAHIEQAR